MRRLSSAHFAVAALAVVALGLLAAPALGDDRVPATALRAAERPVPVVSATARVEADAPLAGLARAVTAEIEESGISAIGTASLESGLADGRVIEARADGDGTSARVVGRASAEGGAHGIVIVVRISASKAPTAPGGWDLSAANVYRVPADAEDADVIATLDAGKLPELVRVELFGADVIDRLVASLPTEARPRRLYHVADWLLAHAPRSPEAVAAVDEVLAGRGKEMAASGKAYRAGFLALLRGRLPENAAILELARAILAAPLEDDASAAELAAITLAERDESSDRILELVRGSLGSPAWVRRRLGLRALARIQTGAADECLVLERVGDVDGDVRKAAIEVALTFELEDDHLATLVALQGHGEWQVRRSAAGLIGRIAGRGATAALVRGAADADGDVRKAAVAALAPRELDGADVPPIRKHLVPSSDWKVRALAARILAGIDDPAATAELLRLAGDADGDVRKTAVAAARGRALDDNALALARDLLGSSTWQVRRDAVGILAGGGEAATPLIAAAIGDADGDVRAAARAALADREIDEATVTVLGEHLESSSWQVRRDTLRLIVKAGVPSASALIAKAIGDPDGDVRKAALEAVGEIELDAKAVAALKPHLASADWQVRRDVVRLLARAEGDDVLAVLAAAMADADGDVRKAAREALAARDLGVAVIGPLGRALASSTWQVRRDAVVVLARVEGDRATVAIAGALADGDGDVRAAAIAALSKRDLTPALQPIAAAAESSDWKVRAQAARLLGRVEGEAATLVLVDLVGDGDGDVRRAAVEVIWKRDLSGEATVAALGTVLEASDWQARRVGAELLARTTSAKALVMLRARAKAESDGDVKRAIAKAIKALEGSVKRSAH